MNTKNKILTLNELLSLRENWRIEGVKVVVTNGCFDILHLGHVDYLEKARTLGGALLIGVNSDKAVRELDKGVGRPFNPQEDRAGVLAALECVRGVHIFNDTRATEFLRLVQPDIYVKGGDYTLETLNQDERRVVEESGGKIEIIPFLPGRSTTNLIQRITETQVNWAEVKRGPGYYK